MEKVKPHPEQKPDPEDKERKKRQEILISLGGDFNVCWDALQETADFSKLPSVFLKEGALNEKAVVLNQKEFFETAADLNHAYLERIKKLIAGGMSELSAKEAQEKITEEEVKKSLADLASDFMTRLEFFSRMDPPQKITLGGRPAPQLENALFHRHIISTASTVRMMRHQDFSTSNNSEQISVVRVAVSDLGFVERANQSIDKIYKTAQDFGLDLCPAEVGPQWCLKKALTYDESLYVAMRPIVSADDNSYISYIFMIGGGGDDVWLSGALSGGGWPPDAEFIFCLPQK